VDAGIELWTKYLEMVREIVPMARGISLRGGSGMQR
jgi:hypothetical protein